MLGRPSDTSEIYTDVATLNMLATATKGFESLQELIKEYKTVQKQKGPGSSFFGRHDMMMNAQMDI